MDLKESLVLGENVEFNTIDIVADLYDLEDLEASYLASLIEHEPSEMLDIWRFIRRAKASQRKDFKYSKHDA